MKSTFQLRWWLLSLLACGVVIGCHKSVDEIGTRNDKVFQSADPEVKANWQIALSAIKTNGYAGAFVALRKLREQTNLSPEQVKALDETAKALSDQIYDGANKGEPNAVEALKDLRQLQRR